MKVVFRWLTCLSKKKTQINYLKLIFVRWEIKKYINIYTVYLGKYIRIKYHKMFPGITLRRQNSSTGYSRSYPTTYRPWVTPTLSSKSSHRTPTYRPVSGWSTWTNRLWTRATRACWTCSSERRLLRRPNRWWVDANI